VTKRQLQIPCLNEASTLPATLRDLPRSIPGIDVIEVLVVAGDGTQRANVEALAAQLGVADRIVFLGSVQDDALVELYRDALAVAYPPYDEDFGYVTLEAFLARRPVITATDSGGPNEFVIDGVNGFVCAPEPDAFAAAINLLAASREKAKSLGDAGYERAAQVTWDGVIEKLIS
jgi:glycosyltransferase involved in cell wall biosynthesis